MFALLSNKLLVVFLCFISFCCVSLMGLLQLFLALRVSGATKFIYGLITKPLISDCNNSSFL